MVALSQKMRQTTLAVQSVSKPFAEDDTRAGMIPPPPLTQDEPHEYSHAHHFGRGHVVQSHRLEWSDPAIGGAEARSGSARSAAVGSPQLPAPGVGSRPAPARSVEFLRPQGGSPDSHRDPDARLPAAPHHPGAEFTAGQLAGCLV